MSLTPSNAARPMLVIAMLVVFLPLLSGEFVWDDHLLVVENSLTDSLLNAGAMFRSDLWAGTPVPEADPGYYRPLVVLDLAVTRAIAGLSPFAHRLHNLLWHGLAVALLLRWLQAVLSSRLAATMGAAVFAVHPVQLEAVGFVSARNDPMAVAWLLIALLWLADRRPSPRALFGGAVAACAAMLCKESVVFAPVLLACAARVQGNGWGSIRAHGAIASGFAVAASLRFAAGVGLPAQADGERLWAVLGPSVGFYLDKLVWPLSESPVIHLGWSPPVPWWTAGIAAAGVAAIAVRGGPIARSGVLIAVLGFLPSLAAIAHVGAVVDRYLYLAMVGVAWMAAGAARHAAGRAAIATAVAAMVVMSVIQAPVWANDRALWAAAIERAPSGYAKGALARTLEDTGDAVGAAHWYREAVIQPPQPFHESCFNVTRIHLKLGDPKRAIAVGNEALEAGCDASAELVAPLALAYALEGEWASAIRTAQVIPTDPTGKALVARLAAGAAMGDLEPLERARDAEGPGLVDQVMVVLARGGADAEAIRDRLSR